jgi:hypothetical protein
MDGNDQEDERELAALRSEQAWRHRQESGHSWRDPRKLSRVVLHVGPAKSALSEGWT